MSKLDFVTAPLMLLVLVICYTVVMSCWNFKYFKENKKKQIFKYSAQILHSIYIPSWLVFSLPLLSKIESSIKVAGYTALLFILSGISIYFYDLILYSIYKHVLKAQGEELTVVRKQLRFLSEKGYNTVA